MAVIDLAGDELHRTMIRVESRNEMRTVIWRFFALAVFAISVVLEPDIESHGIHLILLAAYTGTSLTAVFLVATGAFRASFNWVYVFIDAVLVVYLAAEHMFIPGISVSDALATPSLAIAFVLLAHASMRMRVGPVLFFAAIVSLGSIVTGAMSLFADPYRMGLAQEELQAASVRLLAFAAVAAIQIMLVVDIKRLVRSTLSKSSERANLARFFSPGTAELLASKGLGVGLERHEAAVMFLDIRGFTSLAEEMPLEEVASLLSDFRHRVVAMVSEYGGTIDKFIGDGVMVVFGFPASSQQDTANAFDCSQQLVQQLGAWSDRRVGSGEAALSFGIGLHHGSVIGGVIAAGDHNECTVLGDAVNLASRLQAMCRSLDADIVMSRAMAERLHEHRLDGRWTAKSRVRIPGRTGMSDVVYLPSGRTRPSVTEATGLGEIS